MTEVHPIPKQGPKAKKPRKKKGLTPAAECDALFSKIIRTRGRCEGRCGGNPSGYLQCAHGFSRRYRAVRWDERNAWCLCAGCHHWWTHRPLEWDEWMKTQLGEGLYEELRELALHGRNPDLKVTVARLRERWAQIEGRAA